MKSATVIALTRAAYRQGSRDGLDATRVGLEAERDRLQARVKQLEADAAFALEANRELVADNLSWRRTADEMRARVEALEQRPDSARIVEHLAEIADLRRENERLRATVAESTSPSNPTGQALQDAQMAAKALESDVARLTAERNRLTAKAQEMEAGWCDAVARMSGAEANRDALQGVLVEARAERNAAYERVRQLSDEVDSLTVERDDVDSKLIAVGKERDRLRADIETACQERAYAEARRQEAERQAADLRAENAQFQALLPPVDDYSTTDDIAKALRGEDIDELGKDAALGRLVQAMPEGYLLVRKVGFWRAHSEDSGYSGDTPEEALIKAFKQADVVVCGYPTPEKLAAALRAEEPEPPAKDWEEARGSCGGVKP